MGQRSFGDAEYAGKRKQTRPEVFLAEMEQVVPWKPLLHLIEPFYPVAGRGRHPYPLETMLRVHLMQNWFGLSDPAMEGERDPEMHQTKEGQPVALRDEGAHRRGC
jgi:transposase, IS5 family